LLLSDDHWYVAEKILVFLELFMTKPVFYLVSTIQHLH
jgi:hypothetical protein